MKSCKDATEGICYDKKPQDIMADNKYLGWMISLCELVFPDTAAFCVQFRTDYDAGHSPFGTRGHFPVFSTSRCIVAAAFDVAWCLVSCLSNFLFRNVILKIDQSEFEGFEYINPLLMSQEDCVWEIHLVCLYWEKLACTKKLVHLHKSVELAILSQRTS